MTEKVIVIQGDPNGVHLKAKVSDNEVQILIHDLRVTPMNSEWLDIPLMTVNRKAFQLFVDDFSTSVGKRI